MFVTVFFLILDTQTGEVEYCNGGHNPPLLCTQNGCFEFINVPKGFVVGAMEHLHCEGKRLVLKPNDTIFLYTDGVTEAMNPKKELFSENRLKEGLELVKDKGLQDIVASMRWEVSNHAQDEPQSDDITMLLLRYNGRSHT
jgi:sigma-B regulation protein RsbU (phosphoserine phosphatase)